VRLVWAGKVPIQVLLMVDEVVLLGFVVVFTRKHRLLELVIRVVVVVVALFAKEIATSVIVEGRVFAFKLCI